MCAVLVVPHPAPLNGSGIQLGACIGVYPDVLPPFGYVHQVWLLSVEMFVWCDVTDGPC